MKGLELTNSGRRALEVETKSQTIHKTRREFVRQTTGLVMRGVGDDDLADDVMGGGSLIIATASDSLGSGGGRGEGFDSYSSL